MYIIKLSECDYLGVDVTGRWRRVDFERDAKTFSTKTEAYEYIELYVPWVEFRGLERLFHQESK